MPCDDQAHNSQAHWSQGAIAFEHSAVVLGSSEWVQNNGGYLAEGSWDGRNGTGGPP